MKTVATLQLRLVLLIFIVYNQCDNNVKASPVISDILDLEWKGNPNVTSGCKRTLKIIKDARDSQEIWAVKLFAASGQLQADFVYGNNYWLGSRHICESLKRALTYADLNLSNRYKRSNSDGLLSQTPPFDVQYRVTYIQHQSPYYLDYKLFFKDTTLHIGTCFPATCSLNDVSELLEKMLETKRGDYKLIGDDYKILRTKEMSTNKKLTDILQYNLLILILKIVIPVMIIGSVYSYYSDSLEKPSLFDRILLCFAVQDNVDRIFSLEENNKNSLKVIDGLRFLAMLWVVIGHVAFFIAYTLDNQTIFMIENYGYMACLIMNTPLVNEVFFTISGFLLYQTFTKAPMEERAKYPFRTIARMCIRRYFKFLLPYIPALLLFITTVTYLDASTPYATTINDAEVCERTWWRNPLYIINMFPETDSCFLTTWYHATDMQLFIFTSVLLAISAMSPKSGHILIATSFIASIIGTAYIGYIRNYTLLVDVNFNSVITITFPPWNHYCPFIIGVITSILYSKTKENKFKPSSTFINVSITIGIFIAYNCLFGRKIHQSENPIFNSLLFAIGRPMLSCVIAIAIYAITFGYGSILQSIVGARWMAVPSRISYSVSLINQIVMHAIIMSRETPTHYDFTSMIFNFLIYMITIYVCSLVFCIMFELPLMRAVDVIYYHITSKQDEKRKLHAS